MNAAHDEVILAAVELGPLSAPVLESARTLATRLEVRRIHLVHVVHPVSEWIFGSRTLTPSSFEEKLEAARRQLEKLIGEQPRVEGVVIDGQVAVGEPAYELARIAAQLRVSLTVVAIQRPGLLGHRMFTSVAGRLLRITSSPLLIVGADRVLRSFNSVIAAVDLSRTAPSVLAMAQKMTAPLGDLRVLSAAQLEELASRFPNGAMRGPSADERVQVLESRYYAKLHRLVEQHCHDVSSITVDVHALGAAREVILDSARSFACDLLVIGTSGHRTLERWIHGSTAGWIAVEASSPVLVCPAPVAPRVRQGATARTFALSPE